jgi:hypothetical protein
MFCDFLSETKSASVGGIFHQLEKLDGIKAPRRCAQADGEHHSALISIGLTLLE